MTTAAEESAGFEHDEDGGYLQRPSPKRIRYDAGGGNDQNSVMQVPDLVEAVEVEDAEETETVTITVPSSQFEIEINSQADEEEGEEIPQIQRTDLTGPNFSIVQDPQELTPLDSTSRPDEGGTLTAIGRALLQMQQSGQKTQSIPASLPPSTSQQLYLNRSTSVPESASSGGPLYVMIPPASSAEILQAMGQTRPIAPKASSPIMEMGQHDSGDPKSREAQRKATHNEVERRRRDRINDLIKTLAMIVPGCQKKDATTGTVVGYVYSKGTVLDKTVEYLKELMDRNEKLANNAKLAEKSASALALVQNQIAVLEKENAFLRAQIIQFGIDAAASSSAGSSHHHQQQQQQQQQQQNAAAINRQFLTSPLAQSLLNTVAQSTQPSAPSIPLPPVTPPLPPPAALDPSTPAAAQQLLLSLAQTLTNSPLLTSLSQNPTVTPASLSAASNLITTSIPSLQATPPSSSTIAASTASLLPPIATSPARISLSQAALTPVTPQPIQTTSIMPQSSSAMLQPSPSQVTPLITSLVQTLTSIANTNVISSPSPVPLSKSSPTKLQALPPQPVPSVPMVGGGGGGGGGISAAAAAGLLNTLIMAQNLLTNSGSVGQGGGGGVPLGDLSSVLTGSMSLDRVDQ